MYIPNPEILEKYASVLVNFALNGGKGVKKSDVVVVAFDQIASPLAIEVYKKIIEAGAHAITKPHDYKFTRLFYEKADESQLSFFPSKYNKALISTMDHYIRIIAEVEPDFLRNVDPQKIIKANSAQKKMREWMDKKEDDGRFSWTLGLYGTEGMAKEAGIKLEDYWNEIEKACFLNEKDPISKWKKVEHELSGTILELNKMAIDSLRIEADQTDLKIDLGRNRKFIGGGGKNIPSFEIFTSPDWRGTEGQIFFDYPLYRYGNIIKEIKLNFKNGIVVKSSARQNENLLIEMINQKNANKIGEFSLTDKRFAKINRFMANTLYDENFGGDYGNTHIAIGKSYHDTYNGDFKNLGKTQWKDLGFNESHEHCDIIATTERRVTATLKNGGKKVIYENGEFRI